MIVVITGNNDYAALRELKQMVNKFVKDYGDFGLEKLDGADTEPGQLLDMISSVPFLSEKRMVVITNFGANKTLIEHIEQIIDSIYEACDLVIYEHKFDKRSSLYKTLKKRTEFREFNVLNEQDLSKWLVVEATNREGELKPNDANYFIYRAGTNQMLLSNELDKLLSYNPKIDQASIDALIEPLPLGSVFDLLDSAFAGNKQKTVNLYKSQRKQLAEPQAIMSMIAWQLHVLASVKFAGDKPAQQIAKDSKLNPFVVNKALTALRSKTKDQIKGLVKRATELDQRLKSEMIDADDAVMHFLLTI